jgi:hypothetical protein
MNQLRQKFGGRTKGVPNKQTSEIRHYLTQLIENNLETLESDLNELNAKDRLNIVIQLLKYVTPQFKSVEIIDNNENQFEPIVFTFDFNDEKKS